MSSFLDQLKPFRPLLGILEANRLRLLQSVFEYQSSIKEITKHRDFEQSYIQDLEKRLEAADGSMKEQTSYIQRLETNLEASNEQRQTEQSYIQDLEKRLEAADGSMKEQTSYIQRLETNLKASNEHDRLSNLISRIWKSDLRPLTDL